MSKNLYRLGLLWLLVSIVAGAQARDWIVAPDGSGDAPTIQAAVDSAVWSTQDRVVLLDGYYTGEGNRDVNVTEKIVVISSQSDNPAACIIDCQGTEDDHHFGFGFWGGG